MTDSIFLLRCVDCDALGGLSRLWIRASVEVKAGRATRVNHYVECMNCGAHLKSRQNDLMELVNDDEWRRFVGDGLGTGGTSSAGTQRVD